MSLKILILINIFFASFFPIIEFILENLFGIEDTCLTYIGFALSPIIIIITNFYFIKKIALKVWIIITFSYIFGWCLNFIVLYIFYLLYKNRSNYIFEQYFFEKLSFLIAFLITYDLVLSLINSIVVYKKNSIKYMVKYLMMEMKNTISEIILGI